MNLTAISAGAIVAGVVLSVWISRAAPPIHDADEVPGMGVLGIGMILLGAWGVLSLFANASDLFFVIAMAAAVLALIARGMGCKAKGGPRALPVWAAFAFSNALVFASIGVAKTFVIEPMNVPSSSMRPSLVVGDLILLNKFAYGIRVPFTGTTMIRTGAPQRGDVVVFRYPVDPTESFVKRIVGLPGDTVSYRDKVLTINGVPIKRAPLGTVTYVDDSGQERTEQAFEETLGHHVHRIFNDVTSPPVVPSLVQDFDHLSNCTYDERGFECVVPQGSYFAMGDNRDNSNDSRYWGFVSDKLLLGKAVLIGMNLHESGRIGKPIR